jgi:3-oxoacyl-[acyl-carrier protein] reductase
MCTTIEANEDDVDLVLATNLKNALWLAKHCAPHMPKTEKSCIITSPSIWAEGRKPGAVAYTASKAALTGVARSWAYELSPIRSVSMTLGAIDTPMYRLNLESTEAIARETLAARPGRPGEVAEAVLFIASCC